MYKEWKENSRDKVKNLQEEKTHTQGWRRGRGVCVCVCGGRGGEEGHKKEGKGNKRGRKRVVRQNFLIISRGLLIRHAVCSVTNASTAVSPFAKYFV